MSFRVLIRSLRKMADQKAVTEEVEEAFRNAAENGHDFAGWTNQEVAHDMMECDASLEVRDPNMVLAAVRAHRGVQYG